MTDRVMGHEILSPTEACVVRPQQGQHLFYNAHTDELHLVPPLGYYAVKLCNGLRSVEQVEDMLADGADVDPPRVRAAVRSFLGGMVTRGVLEVVNDN